MGRQCKTDEEGLKRTQKDGGRPGTTLSRDLSMRGWGRAAVLASLHALAIAFFLGGFLLSKAALNDTSEDSLEGLRVQAHERIVIVIVDALRYDLALSPHLSSLEDSLARWPDDTVLFRFRADPPTTTLQRLKALTTGTLPTIIEAGSNFASFEVTEDSLLRQWRRADRRVIFAGDDTWLSCFPDAFSESYGFPSFDVWDLDTVDRGVEAHFLPALVDPGRWDILIGHLLGVDHAGHRYGRTHPAMTAKLAEMDAFLGQVIRDLPPGTLLAVMGDHGMTESGDHGGDSLLETDAALFLYRKPFDDHPHPPLQRRSCDLCASTGAHIGDVIHQVDLVPTLALLSGVPVPFSSVGVLVPSLFSSDAALADALAVNAAQLKRYLEHHTSGVASLPAEDIKRLDARFAAAEQLFQTNKESKEASTLFLSFLREGAQLCRTTWTEFDPPRMVLGCLLGSYAVLSALVSSNLFLDVLVAAIAAIGYFGSFFDLFPSFFSDIYVIVIAAVVLAAALAVIALWFRRSSLSPQFSGTSLFIVSCVLMLCGVFASNSFVVWEDHVTSYLLVSLLAVCGLRGKVGQPVALLLLASAVLVRWTSMLTVCREEQGNECVVTTVPEEYNRLAVAAFATFGVATLRWGAKSTFAAVAFLSLLALNVAHWELTAILSEDDERRVILPRCALAAASATVFLVSRDVKLVRYVAVLMAVLLLSGPFAVRVAAAHMAITGALLRCSDTEEADDVMSWLVDVTHWVSAQHFFFRAGHQATLSSIQWWPAYLVVHRTHVIISGTVVTSAFFGGALLLAAGVHATTSKQSGLASWVVRGATLTASMVCTMMLRRHLMVWKIFAPRLIVAAGTAIIADAVGIMLALFNRKANKSKHA